MASRGMGPIIKHPFGGDPLTGMAARSHRNRPPMSPQHEALTEMARQVAARLVAETVTIQSPDSHAGDVPVLPLIVKDTLNLGDADVQPVVEQPPTIPEEGQQ